MSYEYYGPGLGALGFSNPRGACTEIANGETRCFREREAGSARSQNCQSLTTACEVGGDGGTMYCCPQFGATRAPEGGATPAPAAATPEGAPETLLEQGWDWFREVIGAKGQSTPDSQPLPMPGVTADGKPSAAGFSAYVREAAVREIATVDEEQAPVQETPDDDPRSDEGDGRSWIERYQTHITLVSTLVGLGTFVIWLVVRKKD